MRHKLDDFSLGQVVRPECDPEFTGTVVRAYKEDGEDWVEVLPYGDDTDYRKCPAAFTWKPESLLIIGVEDVDTKSVASYYHAVTSYEA